MVIQDTYQPGDLVKVIAPDYDEQESLLNSVGFNDDMECDIGETFRIVCEVMDHGHLCYSLEGSEWTWAHEWLVLVEPAKPRVSFTDEDFDLAFS